MTVEFNILYRWHSMIPDELRLGGRSIKSFETLWNTGLIIENGLAQMFNDTSAQAAGRIGPRNTWEHLAKMADAPTIRMGRTVQLATYNDYREMCGLPRVTAFNQISSDEGVQKTLEDLYTTVDRIEFYPGMFCEDLRPNSALAPLVGIMVGIDAFSQALTNPLLQPRVFCEETFSPFGWDLIQKTHTIEELVRRNTPEHKGDYHITMTRPGWCHE
jgi:prostaglandin-endoperoxide synthase 2